MNGAESRVELNKEAWLGAFSEMFRARMVDEKTITLYKQNKCFFQIGCAGHEAVGAAAGRVFRPEIDWSYPYYRDMSFCIALGMTNRELLLNAMNKADDPCSHGRQLPVHFGHRRLRIMSQSSPTGTQFLQAVGCALAIKRLNANEVVYVSAGEGACSQGDFHEAANWAAREKLPLVIAVQNNKFAISVPVSDQIAGGSVAKLVQGYAGLVAEQVDGTNFADLYTAFTKAHARALSGEGPALVEALVPRLQGHSISDNQTKYRDEAELAADKTRCPLLKMERDLLARKFCTQEEINALKKKLLSEIDADSEWAEKQPDCDATRVCASNFADPDPGRGVVEKTVSGPEVYMVDALNHALDEELARDNKVYVFGEDVAGRKGGVFSVTSGLSDKHGNERVFNSQLAESSIVGAAIGMAARGLKPVVEIQFADFIWPAMNQIRSELAMMHYRTDGEFSCPVVVRTTVGGYIHGAAYHSQSIEATFGHFPGLFIVYPSNATDAKGLLKSAIRCRDPVMFLEPKSLYRQVYAKGAEGDSEALIPLGKAKVVRPGKHATVICWGALVNKCLNAARALAKSGREVEVIDLRTLVPLDMECIEASVKKTNRVLITHEDVKFLGFGAEIAAQLAENLLHYLDAPIRRIGMKYAACVAHAPALEAAVLPSEEEVLQTLKELLAF